MEQRRRCIRGPLWPPQGTQTIRGRFLHYLSHTHTQTKTHTFTQEARQDVVITSLPSTDQNSVVMETYWREVQNIKDEEEEREEEEEETCLDGTNTHNHTHTHTHTHTQGVCD